MKGLKSLITGIATITALGSSLEARADSRATDLPKGPRQYTFGVEFGGFIPLNGDLNDLYGPGDRFGLSVVRYKGPVGMRIGYRRYSESGDLTVETTRIFLGGERITRLKSSEITINTIEAGLRLVLDPSITVGCGFEYDGATETQTFKDEIIYGRVLDRTIEVSDSAFGVYGSFDLRAKIGSGATSETYLKFEIKGNSAQLQKNPDKNVNGVSLSVGLEVDIY